MPKKNIKAYIAWINICIVWGTTYFAIRIGVGSMPPMLFAGFRWIFAGLILLLFLKIKKYKLPNKTEFLHNAIIGVFLIGVSNGLVVFSEQWIESGTTALLLTTSPFWMAGIEAFVTKDNKFNLITSAGLLLGLAGILLIFGNNLKFLFQPSHLIGISCLLISIITWAGGTVYSKHQKLNVHPMMSAAIQMLVAGCLQTLLGISLGEFARLNFELNGILAFIYLLIFGSLVGYTSYIYAVQHLPVSLVSTYAYINPIIAIILGWFFLNENVTPITFIASIVIILGVIVVKKGAEKKELEIIPESN